jgi:hypothetical protein
MSSLANAIDNDKPKRNGDFFSSLRQAEGTKLSPTIHFPTPFFPKKESPSSSVLERRSQDTRSTLVEE